VPPGRDEKDRGELDFPEVLEVGQMGVAVLGEVGGVVGQVEVV